MPFVTGPLDADRAASAPAVPRPPRLPRRAVHGVLLLDKPLGLSSNDALQKAKRLYRAEKAGHTGTLDPLATGLLPICFGAATKFSQVGLDADKRYLATLKLGVTTTTADAEGEIVETRAVTATRAGVEAAAARFLGPIDQVPPMHSALKHEGRALYDYARAGVEIEREPRRVTIHAIEVVERLGHDLWRLDVRCSKGTYIRTLAEDIGRALGCGAHLAALRRIATGATALDGAISRAHASPLVGATPLGGAAPLHGAPLPAGATPAAGRTTLDRACTLEALAAMSEAERDARLLPADALLADWPVVRLDADEAGRFLTGLRRRVALGDAPGVRVYGPEPSAFLGSAHITAGELIPTRLLSPAEVQGLLSSPACAPARPHATIETKVPA